MARTHKIIAAHAKHHDRKTKGKVAQKQELLQFGYSTAQRSGIERHALAREKVRLRRVERAQASRQHRREVCHIDMAS